MKACQLFGGQITASMLTPQSSRTLRTNQITRTAQRTSGACASRVSEVRSALAPIISASATYVAS